MENHGAVFGPVFLHVVEENMIAPESLAQTGSGMACEMLLPVEPPEINTLLLMLAYDVPEKRFCEVRIVDAPGNVAVGVVFAVKFRFHGLIIAGVTPRCSRRRQDGG